MKWVVWSEEHGAWWGSDETNLNYTRSLRRARRYTRAEAKKIAVDANRFIEVGELHEVAMPDPLVLQRQAISGTFILVPSPADDDSEGC